MGRRKKTEVSQAPTIRIDELLNLTPRVVLTTDQLGAAEESPKSAFDMSKPAEVKVEDAPKIEKVEEEPQSPSPPPPTALACECLKHFRQAFKDLLGDVDDRDTLQQHIWTLNSEIRLLKSHALEAHYAEREIEIYKGQIDRLEEQLELTLELIESKELRISKFERFVDMLAEDYSPRAIQDLWRRATKEMAN
jgi:hypothetical protein